MIKNILIAVSLAVSVVANANTADITDFRGIAWGTHFSKHASEMTLVEKKDQMACYDRAGSKMKVGTADLTQVSYCYWNDEFLFGYMKTEGAGEFSDMLGVLTGQFGHPYIPNRYLDEYHWKSAESATVLLKCIYGYTCSTVIESVKINKKRWADKSREAESAGNDL